MKSVVGDLKHHSPVHSSLG